MTETCTTIKQAKQLKPLWYGDEGQNINIEKPGRLIISHSLKPTRVSAMWEQTTEGWKHIQCLMPLPEILPWALGSTPRGDTVLQKELSWAMRLISKTTI